MTIKIIRPRNTNNSLLVVHEIQSKSVPHAFSYKLLQQSNFLIVMRSAGGMSLCQKLNQLNINNCGSLNQVIVSGIYLWKPTANLEDFTKFFMVVLPYFDNKIITSTKAKYARGLNQSLSQNIGGQNRYLTFKLERNDSFFQFDSI